MFAPQQPEQGSCQPLESPAFGSRAGRSGVENRTACAVRPLANACTRSKRLPLKGAAPLSKVPAGSFGASSGRPHVDGVPILARSALWAPDRSPAGRPTPAATLLARPEPDRDDLRQAQDAAADRRRAHRSVHSGTTSDSSSQLHAPRVLKLPYSRRMRCSIRRRTCSGKEERTTSSRDHSVSKLANSIVLTASQKSGMGSRGISRNAPSSKINGRAHEQVLWLELA